MEINGHDDVVVIIVHVNFIKMRRGGTRMTKMITMLKTFVFVLEVYCFFSCCKLCSNMCVDHDDGDLTFE